MKSRHNRTRQVELFQGKKKKDAYFEGWYFRMVTCDQRVSLALIPGISLNKVDPHAFIQVLFTHPDDEEQSVLDTLYVRYSTSEFVAEDDPFSVKIHNNQFSLSGIQIRDEENLKMTGNLLFESVLPIQSTLLSPNIMGFFGYIPNMECYHGLISMKHQLSGSLVIHGQTIDFENGTGYIEKDWGKSFPQSYIWLQANHFETLSTSLMMSIATIPWMGHHFKGHIVNLIHEGKEYRFATYNGSRIIQKEVSESHLSITFKKGKRTLKINAFSTPSKVLIAPKMGVMDHKIKEGMQGRAEFELFEKGKLILRGVSRNAALEVVLDIEQEVVG